MGLSLLLSAPFSPSLSVSVAWRLAIRKLPMNERTVDTKRIVLGFFFFTLTPLYGQWIMKLCDPSSGLSKH